MPYVFIIVNILLGSNQNLSKVILGVTCKLMIDYQINKVTERRKLLVSVSVFGMQTGNAISF